MSKSQANAYDYLDEIGYEIETEEAAATFEKIKMGGASDSVDKVTGLEIQASRFNASNFPGFNFEYLIFIPLMLQPGRRALYLDAYDPSKAAVPPSCFSNDGVRPSPSRHGTKLPNMEVTESSHCATCPYSPFQAGCKPRPLLYGVSLFNVNGELKYIPNFIDVPVTSKKHVDELVKALYRPVTIDGKTYDLSRKPFSRVLRINRDIATKQWLFSPLTETSREVDPFGKLPVPNFAPKEFLDGVADLHTAALMLVKSMDMPRQAVAQIASAATSPQLTGSIDAAPLEETDKPF
jgi:hypothetical protein